MQDALNSIQAFDSLQGPYFSVYKCHPMCWWLIYHYRSARPGAEFSLRGLTVMDLSVEHHTDWFHVPADVCFGAHAVHKTTVQALRDEAQTTVRSEPAPSLCCNHKH